MQGSPLAGPGKGHSVPGPNPGDSKVPQIQAQAEGSVLPHLVPGEAPAETVSQQPPSPSPQQIQALANHPGISNSPKLPPSTRGPSLLETPRQLPLRTPDAANGNPGFLGATSTEMEPTTSERVLLPQGDGPSPLGTEAKTFRSGAALSPEKGPGTQVLEMQDPVIEMPATPAPAVNAAPTPRPAPGNRPSVHLGPLKGKEGGAPPAEVPTQASPAARPASEVVPPAPAGTRSPSPSPENASTMALRAEGHAFPSTPTTPTFALTHPQSLGIPPQAGSSSVPVMPATSAAPAHPVVMQVGDSLKWILRQSNPTAELQLHPENLGKVTIQLKVDGTEVHARVWASEATTLPVLQDHRAYLEVSLRQQGLQLGSFDLQQGQRGHQPQSQLPSQPAFGAFGEEKAARTRQETPIAMASTFASSHRIEVMA